MDIGKAFTYVFDDEEWIPKILIGGVLGIIPIVNFVASGYSLQTFRNVVRGVERPLPEWSDLGEKFSQGLALFVISVIYNLPVFLLTACRWATELAILSQGSNEEVRTVVSLIHLCLATPYGLVISALWPAVFIRYAATGDFTAAFNFREIFTFIQDNVSNYVIAVILAWALGIVAGFGLVFFCVGVLFTSFWASLVKAHLFGELYRPSTEAA